MQQVYGSKPGELGISSFLLGRSLCLLLGRLLWGNGTKPWLRRQTSPLCTKQTLHGFTSYNPVYITNTLWCVWTAWLCREGLWPRVVTAWVGALASRPSQSDVVFLGGFFAWVSIDCSLFCVKVAGWPGRCGQPVMIQACR